jgi:hypothetical protein
MGRRRDPNFRTGHLCRFCGELVPWGAIVRLIRTDPDTPPYMLAESACHLACLERVLRPGVALRFARHWPGTGPLPDDEAEIAGHPCAICATDIAPPELVRLRAQRPVGPVKAPAFDEQSLPFHFECLAGVSTTRLF